MFSEGDRLELVRMVDDPDPVPPGTRGTVTGANLVNLGGGALGGATSGGFLQVWVAWDNGRALALSIPPDSARKVVECDHCGAEPYVELEVVDGQGLCAECARRIRLGLSDEED